MNKMFRVYLYVLCYGPRWMASLFPRRWKAREWKVREFQDALRKRVRP